MSNQGKPVRQTAAVLMACGLIVSLLQGFAAADKADNQWGPGYRITDNGLRIDGIRADNPTNRVIYDNDFYFDAVDFAYLAAQDKLGRVDFKGFIVTRNSHMGPDDGYAGNSDDGWAAYVTGMMAPVVNIMEDFGRPNGYDKSKGQYEPLPNNPLIKAFYNTKVIKEKDSGIVDGGLVVWLFNQNLVTGVQRRDLTVPGVFSSRGRLLKASIRDVNRSPYGHLHLPDGSCKFAAMIDAMVAVLADPRVWDADYSAKPVPNQSTNPIASAQAIDQTTQVARTTRAGAIVPLDGPVLAGRPVTFRSSGNRNIHWKNRVGSFLVR